MWREYTAEGVLRYPNFIDTVLQVIPMYYLRAIGGSLFLIGAILMVYNLFMTMRAGSFIGDEEVSAPALEVEKHKGKLNHRWLESKSVYFFILTAVAIVIGGLVELLPGILGEIKNPTKPLVKPYTALELTGRDIYIREGCVNCHSQMIRPFKSETDRYGEYGKAGDYVYEHPFLWGSKRTGPDLLREGGKRPDSWHYNHMLDPQITSEGSIMPKYPWLFDQSINPKDVVASLKTMAILGVPYSDDDINNSLESMKKQAEGIIKNLKEGGIKEDIAWDKEIIAVIAYLQILGKRVAEEPEANGGSK